MYWIIKTKMYTIENIFISTTFDNLLFKFNIHSYTYYILHKCTYIIKLATKSLFKKIII